tara:strand:+ start:695 stop:856 length:162 start_codon:yes stop_codon:yes gene_type:complete
MSNKAIKKILKREDKLLDYYIYKVDIHQEYYLTKIVNLNRFKTFLVKILVKFV